MGRWVWVGLVLAVLGIGAPGWAAGLPPGFSLPPGAKVPPGLDLEKLLQQTKEAQPIVQEKPLAPAAPGPLPTPDKLSPPEGQVGHQEPPATPKGTTGAQARPEDWAPEVKVQDVLASMRAEAGAGLAGELPRFGENFFRDAGRIKPLQMAAVPDGYVIGPGDAFLVTLWGRIEAEYTLTVDNEGGVMFPKVGPVRLGGLTYAQAREVLKARAESITGVNAAVILDGTRGVQIFVVGEARRPGTHTLPALSTVIHALVSAGGPTRLGSLRRVLLRRRGKVVSRLDMYAFLLQGKADGDRPLENGDTVVIPQVGKRVWLYGKVERPAVYELLEKEALGDLLRYGGGLSPDAYGARIQVERTEKRAVRVVLDLPLAELDPDRVRLQDGDVVRVFAVKPELTNSVRLFGHVFHPGVYAFRERMRISDVIRSEEELQPDVALQYAVILRETGSDRRKRLLSFRLGDALANPGGPEDLPLAARDEIYVFRRDQLEPRTVATIRGEVRRPGTYRIEQGTRVSDLVQMSGGLTERALAWRAELLRFNPDRSRTTLYVDLTRALAGDSRDDLALRHQDEIIVHSQYENQPQDFVQCLGEVNRPGRYPLTVNMRVADLIFAAGDLTKKAYRREIHLFRTDLTTGTVSFVRLDLERALAGDPSANRLLRDLDRLVVYSAEKLLIRRTVQIGGEVQKPGEYPFGENLRVRDLVLAAGGLRDGAHLGEAEIVRTEVPQGGDEAETRTIRFSLERAMAGDQVHNLLLQPYDKVLVRRIPEWRDTWKVTLSGEVRFPGTYYVAKGERLSSVLRRAGGYTPDAYLRGAVFTRESARQRQQRRLDELRDKLQQAILRASSQEVMGALSPEDVAAQQQYLAAQQQLLRKIGSVKATGRVVIRLLPLDELQGSTWDLALEDGDNLTIPQRPQTVSVVGAVYNPTSLLWEPELPTVEHYLEKTGGPTPEAQEDEIYVVRADGTVVSTRSLSSGRWWARDIRKLELNPGDTVLVPEKVIRVSYMKEVKDITQILYQIAVTAGVAVALF